MLDQDLKQQLSAYLAHLKSPIELTAWGDDGANYQEMVSLLRQVAQSSPLVSLKEFGDERHEAAHRNPSFEVSQPGVVSRVEFAGCPLGHEFTSLVLALLHVSGHPPKIDGDVMEHIKSIDRELVFETYFSQSCQNCPDVVQALNMMAALNPLIKHVAIDGAWFQQEVEERQIMAVPTVYLNGQLFGQGRMTVDEIVKKVSAKASASAVEKLSAKPAFDVLVVGGGPAGASAAIYAARKGISVGLVTERFGGQVLDTMSIENFISVTHTEGPKLVADLERHVREYGVDIMVGHRVDRLERVNGLTHIHLDNGAVLKAKTVIVSTGAKWRQTGVVGEEEYRNKGVTYCPHCDGPLFKGKDVVVIGGGNSGVEAAIDLAGIARRVTLLEFDGKLRADAVLQNKLNSLPNTSVIVNAHTQKIEGDGGKVTSLLYRDRQTGIDHSLSTDGIFVQIGLVPSTQWLKDSDIQLSPHGEVVIDERGQTSMEGVFAAGDATTVPFKQIVVAMGAGSTAALSSFEHLMRQ